MALVFTESFDRLPAARLNGKWTSFDTTIDVSTTAGRHSKGARSTSGTKLFRTQFPTASQDTTLIVGCNVRFDALPGAAQTLQVWKGDLNVTSHLTWKVEANGNISVHRGATQVAITDTPALVAAADTYLEFKAILDDTAGMVEIWVDGVAVKTVTDIDTQNGGTTALWTDVEFTLVATGSPNIDDIYIINGLGEALNDVIGEKDIIIEPIYPTSHNTTASTPWEGSDGNSTDNHLLIDDALDADPWDTDFVQYAGPGGKDLYGFSDLSTTNGQVLSVAVYCKAKKDATATKTLSVVVRDSDGAERITDSQALTETFAWYVFPCDTKGAGDGWNITSVNDGYIGVEGDAV